MTYGVIIVLIFCFGTLVIAFIVVAKSIRREKNEEKRVREAFEDEIKIRQERERMRETEEYQRYVLIKLWTELCRTHRVQQETFIKDDDNSCIRTYSIALSHIEIGYSEENSDTIYFMGIRVRIIHEGRVHDLLSATELTEAEIYEITKFRQENQKSQHDKCVQEGNDELNKLIQKYCNDQLK